MDGNKRRKSDSTLILKETQVLARLLKIKDTKLSNAILKQNVREQNKLGSQLDVLTQHQKKYQFDLTWKKQLILKKQKELMMKSKSTASLCIPVVPPPRCGTLPPIEPKGERVTPSSVSTHSKNFNSNNRTMEQPTIQVRITNKSKTVESNSDGKHVCFTKDTSNERALLRWRNAINKARKHARKPILLSPLLRDGKYCNSDGTKDPRFARLVEQLVPNIGRRHIEKDDVSDEEDNSSSVDSS